MIIFVHAPFVRKYDRRLETGKAARCQRQMSFEYSPAESYFELNSWGKCPIICCRPNSCGNAQAVTTTSRQSGKHDGGECDALDAGDCMYVQL